MSVCSTLYKAPSNHKRAEREKGPPITASEVEAVVGSSILSLILKEGREGERESPRKHLQFWPLLTLFFPPTPLVSKSDFFSRAMSSEKKKKVYFCGSIRAGRGDVDLYGRLVSSLQETHGCRVLTPFVGDPAITPLGSEVEGGDRVIHDRDLQWLREADGECSLRHCCCLYCFVAKNFLVSLFSVQFLIKYDSSFISGFFYCPRFVSFSLKCHDS